MIPKTEEVIDSFGINGFDPHSFKISHLDKIDKKIISTMMKEYGRRLLDHVAEQSIVYRNFDVIDKTTVLQIKDEL